MEIQVLQKISNFNITLVKDYIKIRFLVNWISETKAWVIESLVIKLILNNFFPIEKYCRNSLQSQCYRFWRMSHFFINPLLTSVILNLTTVDESFWRWIILKRPLLSQPWAQFCVQFKDFEYVFAVGIFFKRKNRHHFKFPSIAFKRDLNHQNHLSSSHFELKEIKKKYYNCIMTQPLVFKSFSVCSSGDCRLVLSVYFLEWSS